MGQAMRWVGVAVLGAMVMLVVLTLSLALFGWHRSPSCRHVKVDGTR